MSGTHGGPSNADPFADALANYRAAKKANRWSANANGPAQARPRSMTASGRQAVMSWLVGENGAVICESPEVRQLANEREVRLAYMRGTGPNGRPTRADVLAVAGRQDAERSRAQAAARPSVAPTPTPPPLPAFTASGLDPAQLLSVPPAARMAMAGAETLAAAYKIKNKYGGLSDEEARARIAVDHDVPREYGGYSWPTD